MKKKILVSNYVQNNYRKLDCLLNQSDQIIHKWGSRIQLLSKDQIDKPYESFKTIFGLWDLEELKSSICFVFEESLKDSISNATYSFNLVKLYYVIIFIIEVCFVIYYKNIVQYDIPNSYLLPQQKSSR